MRLELAEVESVLAMCPIVRSATLMLGREAKSLVALVELRDLSDGAQTAADAAPTGVHARPLCARLSAVLDAHAARFLPRPMRPVAYTLAPAGFALPTTANGKLDRARCSALHAEAEARAAAACVRTAESDEPLSAVEVGVANAWCDVLGLEHVRATDDFFRLGGDSIAALAVAKRLIERAAAAAVRECGSVAAELTWPANGEVSGAFAPSVLLALPGLREYAAQLERSGVFLGSADGASAQPRPTPVLSESARWSRALYDSAANGEVLAVAALLDARIDPNAPLFHSLQCGENAGTGEQPRPAGSTLTALHAAAANGRAECVALLVAHGANVNSTANALQRSALLAAASCRSCEEGSAAAEELLRAGAAVRTRDKNKQTVWHFAARVGNGRLIERLGQAADCVRDAVSHDKWSRTPLHWAVLNGHADAVKSLLKLTGLPQAASVPGTSVRLYDMSSCCMSACVTRRASPVVLGLRRFNGRCTHVGAPCGTALHGGGQWGECCIVVTLCVVCRARACAADDT